MPLLETRNLTKRFGAATALDGVSLAVAPGEVLSLLGENGSGKSVLARILSGLVAPDGGELLLDGQPVRFEAPLAALGRGVSVVHHERHLITTLSVAENVFLGREPRTSLGFIHRAETTRRAQRLFDELGLDLDARTLASELSPSGQTLLEIARAVERESRLIVLDDPEALLEASELDWLRGVIARAKAKGTSFLYLAHRPDEALLVADRTAVLRAGRIVREAGRGARTRAELLFDMSGREVLELPGKATLSRGEKILQVTDLRLRGAFAPLSFALHRGEILGIAGRGRDRSEIGRALYGLRGGSVKGRVELFGKKCRLASPEDALAQGLGLIASARFKEGLVLRMLLKRPSAFEGLEKLAKGFIMRSSSDGEGLALYVKDLRAPRAAPPKKGRRGDLDLHDWLATHAKVVFFEDPTRGVDPGTREAIYALMSGLAERGLGVVLSSREVRELVALCDRVLVMSEGVLRGTFERSSEAGAEIVRLL
ncbi:MAG TPA: sugar ABC transporter ATP-binding protein [Anaeromyxobacteraceae bacterium]|nr:sugar ABC transporter ATP-binding protein [Anaeromyxobacteraceae bacterium]